MSEERPPVTTGKFAAGGLVGAVEPKLTSFDVARQVLQAVEVNVRRIPYTLRRGQEVVPRADVFRLLNAMRASVRKPPAPQAAEESSDG